MNITLAFDVHGTLIDAHGSRAWLVSSNPFDVIGAISAGMKAARIQRTPEELFDPSGMEPTITLSKTLRIR